MEKEAVIRSQKLILDLQDGTFRLVHFTIGYALIILELVLCSFADANEIEDEMRQSGDRVARVSYLVCASSLWPCFQKPCPELQSSFLNQLTFWWLTSLVIKAYKNPLAKQDLPVLLAFSFGAYQST